MPPIINPLENLIQKKNEAITDSKLVTSISSLLKTSQDTAAIDQKQNNLLIKNSTISNKQNLTLIQNNKMMVGSITKLNSNMLLLTKRMEGISKLTAPKTAGYGAGFDKKLYQNQPKAQQIIVKQAPPIVEKPKIQKEPVKKGEKGENVASKLFGSALGGLLSNPVALIVGGITLLLPTIAKWIKSSGFLKAFDDIAGSVGKFVDTTSKQIGQFINEVKSARWPDIFGGGLIFGSSSQKQFDIEQMAAKTNVPSLSSQNAPTGYTTNSNNVSGTSSRTRGAFNARQKQIGIEQPPETFESLTTSGIIKGKTDTVHFDGMDSKLKENIAKFAVAEGFNATNPLKINSATRTADEQQKLRDSLPDLAAKGISNHELGKAVDIDSMVLNQFGDSILSKYGLKRPLANEGWHVEAMAKGGVTRGPTNALIGEAGREAVIPLDNESGINAISAAISKYSKSDSSSMMKALNTIASLLSSGKVVELLDQINKNTQNSGQFAMDTATGGFNIGVVS